MEEGQRRLRMGTERADGRQVLDEEVGEGRKAEATVPLVTVGLDPPRKAVPLKGRLANG